MPQPLNAREANLFRQVVRNYEEKQYKRGLKTAEQVLKKHPKHGDTMAMKALIMNAQGKTEEAFALGKEALTVDMKSHICWHVYGLLYRTNKNFEEAIKAYKFALKLEPESSQIQRDLAVLQVQMRDYPGYVASRLAMLQARPQIRQNWTALAAAYHLAGNLAEAENILKTFEETLKVQPSKTDMEHSESVMYRNMIIAESGETQRALDHLESSGAKNLDRLAFMESRAQYLKDLGRREDAEKAYKALLDRNPDHPEYYDALVEVLDVSGEDTSARLKVYAEYAERYPRCDAARRLPLDFLTGLDFEAAAEAYLVFMFGKGVPSTFANLKHLYSDHQKKEALLSLTKKYLEHDPSSHTNGDNSKGRAAALYYVSQHYNYHRSRDLAKSLEYIEMAIECDPKNVDFHMTKARIWKHFGDRSKASAAMDAARELDLRDRHVNTKAAKYQLRNDETEHALKTMALFTKNDTPGGPLADLLDMQSIWFLTEDGESHARQGNLGLALKRFHTIWNIFEIWHEDQFDFHTFSLRKGFIRAYIETMRWEDHLREHPFYQRCAISAAKLYLSIYEQQNAPKTNGVNGVPGQNDSNGDAALEKKKAAKKARKDAQKAEREAAEVNAKQDPNKAKAGKIDAPEELKKKDDDPEGVKLAATADPLGDAMKFLEPLQQLKLRNIEALTVAFDVLLLRKKYLLALMNLNTCIAVDSQSPEVHVRAVQMRLALDKDLSSLPSQVAEIVKSEFTYIPTDTDLKKFNGDYRRTNHTSPQHTLAALRVDALLGEDEAKLARQVMTILDAENVSHDDAKTALDLLKRWHSVEVDDFVAKAKARWPQAASVFI